MCDFPPTLCADGPEPPRPPRIVPPADLPLAALRLAGRRGHLPLYQVVDPQDAAQGQPLPGIAPHAAPAAWMPPTVLPLDWPNTRPATPERDVWLDHIRLEGLVVPEGGQWWDDDTLLMPRPPVGGVPVACQRIPAGEVARRLDRLAALDAPPRHLALRDLMPLLTAPRLETPDHPLRVLRLCDLAPPAASSGPTSREADRDGDQTRDGAARHPSRWLALLTGDAPAPRPEVRPPAVLCGSAAHLAARLSWLSTRCSGLRRRCGQPRTLVSLWLALSTLPTNASSQAVAAALGLVAAEGGP